VHPPLSDDPPLADAELIGLDLACRRGQRLVFRGLSFRLAAGGALTLTGVNGSGKSSLLRIIAGLLAPAAGKISWGSTAASANPAGHRARLHYVGHLDAVQPAMTPREMLSFWGALRGGRVGRTASRHEAALAALGVDGIADWPCRWLSAGQRRRVALARVLAEPAPLWLLDEPTTALDQDGQSRLEQAIASHRAAGGMVIVATHTPLALDGAAMLTLDAFAARAGDCDTEAEAALPIRELS
jgi:heme exporter protein A